ncbi:RISC-loading complex subunit tarbp2-like isoform X2 [Haliotis rufescens]|uniref:RISC-loading complex subunit tarbp2-like isoform X2 n=1 Tax=Haliotis rufescens TaxID=6454 RepID=UPI001EAFC42F|nr:RISC-loading complex subunit tarbp2-like isoform X2 [Haliotis rufescens]
MTVPPGKTPISFLQELCTKRGITPQYDLIANEGAVHEPTFLMRVTVGDVVATGKGSSKKKAKHAAAQTALNQILGVSNGQAPEENDVSDSGEDLGPGNPIGELQEFTQKKLIKPPVYEFTSEQGPPHAREFVCLVKLGKFQERGTGRSKKTAKRNAAQAMMQHIKTLTTDGEQPATIEDSEEEDEIPLTFEPKSSYTALKEGKKKLPVTTPQQAMEIQKFYEKIMKSGGKQIKDLQGKSLNAPSTNFCQMLQEIAEVQRFEVQYFDIKEISVSGLHQCLVQLSTMPVAVCHGSGPTLDEAHANAAHNALQYLKIMTKS